MLEEEASARERGARVLAEVRGAGSGYDCSRGREEAKAVKSVAHSMHFALYDAGMLPYEVECLSASANGSPRGDSVEARAVEQVFGDHARRMPLTAIKAMLGETLGASGALQVVDALETLRDCVLPGIKGLEEVEEDFPFTPPAASRQVDCVNVLVNSVGLDGHSCSLVVARCDE